MAKQTFKIEGLKELEEALKELPKATSRNVLIRALRRAAAPMAEDMMSRAPFLRGQLQRSITTGTKLSRRQRSQHQKVSAVEIFVGAGALVQAITQEFGTVNHAAKPFARPAWDSNVRGAVNIIRDDVAEEIEKARQRLARKAERLAAKIKQQQ